MAQRRKKGAVAAPEGKPDPDDGESAPESDPIPDLTSDLELSGGQVTGAPGAYGLPMSCDVFEPNAETLSRLKDRGVDTRVSRIYIYRMVDGKHERIPGQWSPEEVSTEFLKQRFGPGIYFCKGVNDGGMFVITGRNPIGHAQQRSGFGSFSTGGFDFGQPTNGQQHANPLEVLMLDMLKERVSGTKNDPMRDAMADMMKMMAIQTQSTLQLLQAQVQMKKDDAVPGNDLLRTLLSVVVKNASGKSGGVEEALGLITMGLNLGRQLTDNPGEKPKEDPDWLKAFAILSDSLGPSLAGIVAQTLPNEEQRRAATETIQSHMKAREQEARAEADTIDVDGEVAPDMTGTG